MKIHKLLRATACLLVLAACSCDKNNASSDSGSSNEKEESSLAPAFAKGADISWVTEMESKGYRFYTASGSKKECTALMRDLGVNAVRYRVWVDPSDGWCNKEDVLEKAKRAQRLSLAIMIDFHYSDSWADPAKQNTPSAWASMGVNEMAAALSKHTKEVLKLLKDNDIDVCWVQVGNETRTGMCWPTGKISSGDCANFAILANAGYQAVKSVYPSALVLLHHDVANDLGRNKWFWELVTQAGVKFDMIGLSLYPSYWDKKQNAYPDWNPYCSAALSNFKTLHDTYHKPVMLVEFGMPASEPEKARAALQYMMDGVSGYDWFKGIFYWEPESEQSRNGYAYGAFQNGKATSALEPFAE